MSMPPPGSTRTDTLFPNTSLFRSPWSSLPPYIHHVYTFPPTRKRPGVEPAPSPVLQCPPPIRLRERAMAKTVSQKPTLLSGGNPQIAKGDGDARSEEHTSELQSLMRISYAVFCLKKKNTTHIVIMETTNTILQTR